MNNNWSDKILDSFLEEVVTGRRPPDLLANITTAWQQERAGQIPLPSKTQAFGELVAPPIVARMSVVPKPAAAAKKRNVSHAWHVLLVVAASGILIACAFQWRAAFIRTNDTVATAPRDTAVATLQGPLVASTNQPSVSKEGNEHFSGEKLGIENVPFASREPSQTTERELKTDSTATANRLSDPQIVELIDKQLAMLWQRLKITPESRLGDNLLAQSLSKTLTGQELPSTTAAELTELKSGEGRERVIAQAIDSQAFARLWAKELVADWLRGGSLPLDSEPVERLEEFVASSISGAKPWNQLVSQVISGDLLVSAFAGDGNHRLATHLSGTFLDASLSCVRCHEAKSAAGIANSQEQYWSLVATLMGLDAKSDEKLKERMAIDTQVEVFAETKKPSLFFDRPDGTLEAAKFVLPDGQPWQSVAGVKTPRQALAKWIGNSHQADQAIVNQVWQVALGRPLVASNALVDDVGLAERRELQQMLALQFRAHGRNLSQLVGWVVRSDAFARDSIAVDTNRWLQAAESDIEHWHLAEMTFAARTSLGERAVKGGLESSLAAAVKWNQSKSEVGASVLAQPSVDLKATTQAPVKSEVIMPSLGYAIHRGRLSQAQQSYIVALAASEKLTWEQKVEHIVTLSPKLAASENVKRLSEELLKSLGEPQAALTELLWAIQNAEAH